MTTIELFQNCRGRRPGPRTQTDGNRPNIPMTPGAALQARARAAASPAERLAIRDALAGARG